jgi:hypothetical protein
VNFQRREQTLRPVALIFVLAPRRPPGSGRHIRLCRRLGLDSGLLIQGDDQHVLRRVHVEPADIAQALLELRLREVTHDPVVAQVRLDLSAREDRVCLGARHSHRLAQLLISPALLTRTLRRGRRAGACLRDQTCSHGLGERKRFTRARQIPQARKAIPLIARPPLLRRVRRAPQQTPDFYGRVTLSRPKHDLGTLHHPHLLGTRPRDPRELRPVLLADLDALRWSRHTEPPSSLDTTSNQVQQRLRDTCNHHRTKRMNH